tara:strand:- start:2791 stop:3942 length:1152 start_codon:yes stop_codon:yes gene_type:complete
VQILVDYRPALRKRTGVGELMHNYVCAYTRQPEAALDEVSIFTSSWKDRPDPNAIAELGARVIDLKIPVRVLNYLWHRREWPPIERLTGTVDVVHAAHPLLIPSQQAAQVITVHDLFFLDKPESTTDEIRRDYSKLIRKHVLKAHAIVTPSSYTAELVTRTFGVMADRVHVCPPGPPTWKNLGQTPNQPSNGYVLFIGTLEPRKNLHLLLDAYERLLNRGLVATPLVIAGRKTKESIDLLNRLKRPPLIGNVSYLGYVAATQREQLYAGAKTLVIPSHDEGFGMPALEAMSAGIPVIAANRGALPEVIGNAGPLIEPTDVEELANTLSKMLTDTTFAKKCAERGLTRATAFSWDQSAQLLRRTYKHALKNRLKADDSEVGTLA